MFSFHRDGSRGEEPSFGSAVVARGYALHHLKNACAFWTALMVLSIVGAWGVLAAEFGKEFTPFTHFAVAALFLASAYWGSLALLDLLGEPIPFAGDVSGKHASLFWYKLFFLKDRYYLRLGRGKDRRPLSFGTGVDLREGWFLVGKGYHDILMDGDHVRGTIYRRTRLIASLVKV